MCIHQDTLVDVILERESLIRQYLNLQEGYFDGIEEVLEDIAMDLGVLEIRRKIAVKGLNDCAPAGNCA